MTEFAFLTASGESATTGCTNRQTRAYRIVKQLPRELKGQRPSPTEIARLLEDVQ